MTVARKKKTQIFKSAEGSTRERGRETRRLLRDAAVELFAKHGFQNVSLRMLAQHVGIQPGSIYNHISNKQDFLYLLLRAVMEDLQHAVYGSLDSDASAVEQFRAFVRTHVVFHASNTEAVFIGNMELRNLEEGQLAEIIDMRRAYELKFQALIAAAAKEAGADIASPSFVARAILTMLNGVAGWFSTKGQLSAEQVAEQYVDLTDKMVGISAR